MKDNVRGTFNTLAKAAQKLQKQISTDDVPSHHHNGEKTTGSLKTQSQIELRENVSLRQILTEYSFSGISPFRK